MFDLSRLSHFESRSISAENPRGEKGKGAMAEEGFGKEPARDLGKGWKIAPAIYVEPGEVVELADVDGPGMIKHIWMTHACPLARMMVLRMYWDHSDTPSVEVPLGDFFAMADYPSETLVNSLAVCVNPSKGLNCYWDMPFYKHCRITLENLHTERVLLFYQIDYVIGELPAGHAYFHAQYRRVNPIPYKETFTILDNVMGNGHYVGTYVFWGVNNCGWWGEGELKFFLDGDTQYPTICGTGTEDYFCGAWGFEKKGQYQEYSTAYAGMPNVIRPDGCEKSQQRFSLYRWHLNDPIYFKKDIRITMQALGWRSGGRYLPLQDDISSVAYWYQDSICKTFPTFPSKDELEII